jgi:hypothetical protein
MNGLNKLTSQKNSLEFHHASVRKQEHMEKILGEFSVFINLKKLNNLFYAILSNPGISMKK